MAIRMSTSISAARRSAAVARLRAAGCVFPEDEVAALLGVADDADALDTLVSRRASGLPLEPWANVTMPASPVSNPASVYTTTFVRPTAMPHSRAVGSLDPTA